MKRVAAFACLVGAAWGQAPLMVHAQSAPRLFEWVGMYGSSSGNIDADTNTPAGYSAVPYLWRFDPMTANGTPSSRARNTYVSQQSGAMANPRSGWRAFFVYQDAAAALGGNPVDANDIANTMAWFQNQNYPIDYAFADFEGYYPDGDWSNTYSLINQVRSRPVGARAAIGNFGWYPGPVNLGADYPSFADRRSVSADYATNAANGMAGLTVAMPVGYGLQAYMIHADDPYSWGPGWWTNTGLPSSALTSLTYNQQAAIGAAYLSPNERAGLFYAPLEQVSSAKRNLPAGQQLIPWVSAYQSSHGVPALQPGQVPTPQDNEALLEHYRLRGADGFYAFGSDGVPAYTGTYADGSTFAVAPYRAYAADMAATWHSMDWFFDLPTRLGTITADGPLNLCAFKNTGGTYVDPAGRNGGIEWSAYQRGNRILAVISNLGNGAQAATGSGSGNNGNWQSVFKALNANLPAESPIVPAGEHLVVQILSNAPATNFSAYALNTVLGAAHGWHHSAANFVVKQAAGTGHGSNRVVSIANGAAAAWVANSTTANPRGIGVTINDKMVYSFKVFTGWSGSGSASFAPVVGSGSGVPVPVHRNGPTLWVFTGGTSNFWAFGANHASGGPYHSTNFTPAANTWYDVEMIVDPSTNLATIYAKNLTVGNGSWALLQFDDPRTVPVKNATAVPAGLIAGEEGPSLYDGFQISGSAGAQFDDLAAQLYPYPASPLSSVSQPSGGAWRAGSIRPYLSPDTQNEPP
jgi:hypothetical protein